MRSYDSLRDYILSRPADSDGTHYAICILPSYLIGTSEGDVTPLVIITINEFTISMYIQYCDTTGSNGHLIDASNVTTSLLCNDIPCATGTADLDEVTDYLREVVDEMTTGDYVVDEVLAEERGYSADARVDVLVDI